MKVQAIIFSPIVSLSDIWLAIIVLSNSSISSDFFLFYLISVSLAIFSQICIEVLLILLKNWVNINLTSYLYIASIICLTISVLSFSTSSSYLFQEKLNESVSVFSFFYIYSIGNALTYNYLYFSKVHKQQFTDKGSTLLK
jgi:hypothetical protein